MEYTFGINITFFFLSAKLLGKCLYEMVSMHNKDWQIWHFYIYKPRSIVWFSNLPCRRGITAHPEATCESARKSSHVPHPWSVWFFCTARAEWVGKLTSIPCQSWVLLTALHALASGSHQFFHLTEREYEREKNRLKATEEEGPFNMDKRARKTKYQISYSLNQAEQIMALFHGSFSFAQRLLHMLQFSSFLLKIHIPKPDSPRSR